MESIQSLPISIYEIRGQSVILDKDIAFLYQTETKMLNQAVNLGGHDAELNQLYATIENILAENVAQHKWDKRPKIGFNK